MSHLSLICLLSCITLQVWYNLCASQGTFLTSQKLSMPSFWCLKWWKLAADASAKSFGMSWLVISFQQNGEECMYSFCRLQKMFHSQKVGSLSFVFLSIQLWYNENGPSGGDKNHQVLGVTWQFTAFYYMTFHDITLHYMKAHYTTKDSITLKTWPVMNQRRKRGKGVWSIDLTWPLDY